MTIYPIMNTALHTLARVASFMNGLDKVSPKEAPMYFCINSHDHGQEKFHTHQELEMYLTQFVTVEEKNCMIRFEFAPKNAPIGTKCVVMFRHIEQLFQYMKKFHILRVN